MHYHSHPCFIAHLVLVPSSGSSKEQLQIVSHRESRMTRTLDFSVFPFMSASSNFHPPPPPFFLPAIHGKADAKAGVYYFSCFLPSFWFVRYASKFMYASCLCISLWGTTRDHAGHVFTPKEKIWLFFLCIQDAMNLSDLSSWCHETVRLYSTYLEF